MEMKMAVARIEKVTNTIVVFILWDLVGCAGGNLSQLS
jgi:hypothetical protein